MHLDGSVVFVRLCQCAPLSNTCFFGPTQVHTSDGIAIGSAIFAQLTAEGGYASQIAGPFPSKLPLPIWESGSPSYTWFLGPTQVHNPNCISVGSAVLQGSL